MSDKTRLDAAMETVRDDLQHPLHHSPRRIATRALAAADAHDMAHGMHRVSLDEATVERAASVLAMKSYTTDIGIAFDDYMRVARAVLVAAADVP